MFSYQLLIQLPQMAQAVRASFCPSCSVCYSWDMTGVCCFPAVDTAAAAGPRLPALHSVPAAPHATAGTGQVCVVSSCLYSCRSWPLAARASFCPSCSACFSWDRTGVCSFQLLIQLPQLAPGCPRFILSQLLRMLQLGQDRCV